MKLLLSPAQLFAIGLLMSCVWIYPVFAGDSANRSVPVKVAGVSYIDLHPTVSTPGDVISRHNAVLTAEVESRVESLAEVGDIVEEGEVIVRLDNLSSRILLKESVAELAMTEAKLKFFESEVVRLQQLSAGNNVSMDVVDEAVSDRDEMRGELDARKAGLERARDMLKRTMIIAPFTGVIVGRFSERGEWVKAGDDLLQLVDTVHRDIRARVTHSNIALLKLGDVLKADDGVKEIPVTVKAIVPFSDNPSRLYEIRFDFDEDSWLPGHPVFVEVPVAEPRKAIMIPHDALVVRSDNIKVFRILENNTAEAVPVEIGIGYQDYIEVIGDLKKGDSIVIRGNERLRHQQHVVIE